MYVELEGVGVIVAVAYFRLISLYTCQEKQKIHGKLQLR